MEVTVSMSRRTSRTPKKKKMSYLDDDESEEDFSPSCSSSQGSILSDDGDEDEDFEEVSDACDSDVCSSRLHSVFAYLLLLLLTPK